MGHLPWQRPGSFDSRASCWDHTQCPHICKATSRPEPRRRLLQVHWHSYRAGERTDAPREGSACPVAQKIRRQSTEWRCPAARRELKGCRRCQVSRLAERLILGLLLRPSWLQRCPRLTGFGGSEGERQGRR